MNTLHMDMHKPVTLGTPYSHVQTCSLEKWVVGLRLKGLLVQTYTLAQPLFNGQPLCKNFFAAKGYSLSKGSVNTIGPNH